MRTQPVDQVSSDGECAVLQSLIRNACVNDGTPDSGEEVRNSDLLRTYLEGGGLDDGHVVGRLDRRAGDDAEAKKTVARLIEEIGFAAVDTGDLRDGGATQQPDTAIYNRNLTASEARAILGSEGGY